MSVKDFFTAVIKILAVYVLINGIIPVINNIIYFYDIKEAGYLLGFIGIILVFFAIVFLMLSKADKIVSFLRLDKGFTTERFDFSKTDSNYIVEIAMTIMGSYLIFITIPFILLDAYALLKDNINSHSFQLQNTESLEVNVYTNLLYILVGIIIIFLRKPIANIFTSKS